MLRDFLSFLENLYVRIEFSSEPVVDIIRDCSSDFARKLNSFTETLSLPEAWDIGARSFLCETDRKFVRAVFEDFGCLGAEAELDKLASKKKLCGELLKNAEETLQKKGRVEASVPVYISAVAAIILL